MSALLLSLTLSALAYGQAPTPPAFADGFPVTDRRRVFPLSEVRRGQRGVGYTVFSGDKLEPFGFEVLGVMTSMLGPGKHVILVKLTGEKIDFTGVIAGMSGSPTYIDGRLVGAVAYRFGQFSKEPIAGITPIRSMLEVYSDAVGPKPRRLARAAPGWAQEGLSVEAYHARSLPPLPAPAAPTATGQLQAIQTPLLISGLPDAQLRAFSAALQGSGFQVARAGGAPPRPDGRRLKPNAPDQAGGVTALPIGPGAPIAVPLMQGDLSAAGIGTVTMVEGDRVYGFGHPFMGQGHVRLPMATAAVLNTLASPAGSYKQGLAARTVGSITHDRLTAIAGRLGEAPPLVPVQVTVRRAGGQRQWRTSVEIVDDPRWLPQLLAQVVASAGGKRLGYEGGGSVDLRAVFQVGDIPLEVRDTVVAPPPYSLPGFVGLDVATTLNLITNNPFQEADLRRVHVELSVSPDVRYEEVVAAWAELGVLRPGQPAALAVRLRSYRGGERVVRLRLPLPAGATGEVSLIVGGGVELDRADERVRGRRHPENLEDLLGLLAERRPARALYARAILPAPGVTEAATRYPALPPSQRLGLLSRPGGHLSDRSLGPALTLPQPLPITGSATVKVHVRP